MRPRHQPLPANAIRRPLIHDLLHERHPRVVDTGADASHELDAGEAELAALLRRQDRSAGPDDAHFDTDADGPGRVVLRNREGVPPGPLCVRPVWLRGVGGQRRDWDLELGVEDREVLGLRVSVSDGQRRWKMEELTPRR